LAAEGGPESRQLAAFDLIRKIPNDIRADSKKNSFHADFGRNWNEHFSSTRLIRLLSFETMQSGALCFDSGAHNFKVFAVRAQEATRNQRRNHGITH
jgi:hypothetical protein